MFLFKFFFSLNKYVFNNVVSVFQFSTIPVNHPSIIHCFRTYQIQALSFNARKTNVAKEESVEKEGKEICLWKWYHVEQKVEYRKEIELKHEFLSWLVVWT